MSAGQRVHLVYTEPHPSRGTWTCPARCFATEAAARHYQLAVTVLAGRDAAARRVWSTFPCDCPGVAL